VLSNLSLAAGNYALDVKRDRCEPLVVMRLSDALEVAKAAEGKAYRWAKRDNWAKTPVEAALVTLSEEGSTVVERAR
jgi:hypothetical protein